MARNSRFSNRQKPGQSSHSGKGKDFRKKRESDRPESRNEGKKFSPRPWDKDRKKPSGNFRKRRDDEQGNRSGFERKSFGSSARKGKPFERKAWDKSRPGGFEKRKGPDDGNKPFRDSGESPFGRKPWDKSRPGGFEKRRGPDDGKKPFRESGRGERPFGRKTWDKPKSGGFEKRNRPDDRRKSFRDSGNEGKSFERKSWDRKHSGGHDDRRKGKGGWKERKENKQQSSPESQDDGMIRLNKYISNSGVCSRREADELITAGLITVNGKAITELGYKVKVTDDVRYEGRRLKAEKPVYILLNKPKGFITTTDDPQERNTVMQLIHGACKERVYPVGRLDRNTSGLLLLTNDGELTEKLTHPSYEVKKIYKAELDHPLTHEDFQKIRDGVRLEEGKAMVDDLAVVSDDGKSIGIEIHIGWNRIIRRIFEALGYDVVKLDRTVYASLDKKDLPRGHWRFLRDEEIIRLKHYA